MEAAYDVLVLLTRLFAVGSLLFLAWTVYAAVPRARRARRRADELRARTALLERETRTSLRNARSELERLNRSLASVAAATDR